MVLGGLIMAVFLFWLLIWRPLDASRQDIAERIERQAADLAWMQAAASQASRIQAQPAATGTRGNLSLLALAEQSARGAGLANGFRRGEPVGDDRVRISFEAVSFDQLLKWLALLEQRYAIAAVEFSVDRAGSPGLVDARVMLAE